MTYMLGIAMALPLKKAYMLYSVLSSLTKLPSLATISFFQTGSNDIGKAVRNVGKYRIKLTNSN